MRFSSCNLIFFLNLVALPSNDDFFCFFIAFTAIFIRTLIVTIRRARSRGRGEQNFYIRFCSNSIIRLGYMMELANVMNLLTSGR